MHILLEHGHQMQILVIQMVVGDFHLLNVNFTDKVIWDISILLIIILKSQQINGIQDMVDRMGQL
jgi:hypothetical protein